MNEIGLYIHIPFCKMACSYCNFHFSTQLKHMDALIDAICTEIHMREGEFENHIIKTIYFGGGTPTLLKEKHFKQIFTSLKHFEQDLVEVTIEANPDDINIDKLEIIDKYGFSRFSIGIQSFIQDELSLMNRSHSSEQAHKSLELIKKYGFASSSLDLIFGVPNSDLESWNSNIETALSYGFPHISAYQLTIEDKTALKYKIKTQKVSLPQDEMVVSQFDLVMDVLKDNQYEQYEISNYAKPHNRAIHNTNYWNQVPYIGIGPGAHSYLGNTRSWNISHNIKYMKYIQDGLLPSESEQLTEIDHYNEWIMTGLRRTEGIEFAKINQYDTKIKNHFYEVINKDEHKEYLIKTEKGIKLNRNGIHFADLITASLMYVKE